MKEKLDSSLIRKLNKFTDDFLSEQDGILDKKTILLAGETLFDPLVVRPDKIQEIDENLYAVASGLSTDSALLVGQSRLVAQQHRLIYGEKISVRALASRLGDLMARHTIQGGLRPFGTALILAGFSPVDKEAQLFFVSLSFLETAQWSLSSS